MDEKGSLVKLTKKPKGVTVIEGFPGLGVVATITTSYLLEKLEFEQIGKHHFESKEVAPIVSVHKCKLIDPVSIWYNKKYNLVLIHSITSPLYIEWKAADSVIDICKQLQAKEIISIEGIATSSEMTTAEPNAFYFTRDRKIEKKLLDLGLTCIGEGTVVGVTAALLEKAELPLMAFFADTYSNLPDSRAAAKIIEVLDKYLSLNVDYKPLLKQAVEFEKRIKDIMQKAVKTQEIKEKKELRYVG